jgi:hypothetical protein
MVGLRIAESQGVRLPVILGERNQSGTSSRIFGPYFPGGM